MKEIDLLKLADWGYDFHGCYLSAADGCCYYLASKEPETFSGDSRGRVFHAFAESDDDDVPSQKLELKFFISRTALATARIQAITGDYDTFISKKGAEHLRRLLDRGLARVRATGALGEEPLGLSPIGGGITDPNKHRIELATNSPDEEFKYDDRRDVVTEQISLREEILRKMLTLHLETGQGRINRKELLYQLCADPHRIDRALRSLEDEGFLEGINRGEMKLTPSGDRAAQNLVPAPTRNRSVFVRQQIDQSREPGARVFEEIQEVIEQGRDIAGSDDDAPGIGHNQPPEFLEEFQEIVAQGSAAIREPQLSKNRLTEVRSELARYQTIFMEKFSETMGDHAAKWFWRVLAVLVAHAVGIFDRIVSLLEFTL